MCNICMISQTFVPDRHKPGDPVFEGVDPLFMQTINETTDAAAGTSTSYSMDVGDTFAGAVDAGNDSDWIAITFEAGKTYKIDALGSQSGGGTLGDTDLNLYDSNGVFIEYDDLDGAGFDASITYTATTTGTFYIAVDSYFSTNTGTYSLTVQESVPIPPPGTTGTYEELAAFLKSGTTGGTEYKYNTSQSNVITVNISGLTNEGQQLALWAMEAWEMVVDLDFQIVTSGEMITVDDEDSGAFAYYPNAGSTSAGVELNVSKSWLQTYGTSIDSYSFQTYVHEFGHAIGLNHQGNYNFDPNGPPITYQNSAYFTNDSWQVSVMSYFDQNENTSINASYALLGSTMIADIIAAQDFYGAADGNSVTAGNTIFGHNSNLGNYMDEVFSSIVSGNSTTNMNGNFIAYTLYDQGGIDLFDLSPYSQNLNINLNDGAFSDVGNKIGVIAIAVDTIIENLKLGSGNDTAIGNEADNIIEAGNGNDTVSGGAGNDMIDGGAGTDTGMFSGMSVNYNMAFWGGYVGVGDTAGADGVDLLQNVENLEFIDITMSSNAVLGFDALAYIASFEDLRTSIGSDGLAGLQHYLSEGKDAGREISFSGLEYIASYADLRAIFGANADAGSQHFITFGADAGRQVLFNGLEYIASYADLRDLYGTNADAGAEHYIVQGVGQGRYTSFNGLEYIASHADLISLIGNDRKAGTEHYILEGADAGREVTFDGLEYIASYADLRSIYGIKGIEATQHYILFGANAGREITFDALEYIASYADLRDSIGANRNAGAKHYIQQGSAEGRETTFDGLEYIASYADLRAIYGTDGDTGTAHYILFGADAGRKVTFDGLEYIASYADLRDSIGTNAEAGTLHFIQTGAGEGRSVSFDGYAYLATYADLLNVFGADAEAATAHYIISGADAGRVPDSRDGLDEITTGQTGTGADETLTAGSEAELLAGMGGNDTLTSGTADDVLFGGAGSDTFVFVDGFDNDIIVDFKAQDDNEKIDLSGVTEITDFTDLMDNHLSVVDGVTTITDGANTIALNGVDEVDLGVEDFIFV